MNEGNEYVEIIKKEIKDEFDLNLIKYEPEDEIPDDSFREGDILENKHFYVKREDFSDQLNQAHSGNIAIKQEEVNIKSEEIVATAKSTKRYRCSYCTYETNNRPDFIRHTTAIHHKKGAPTFQCLHCDFVTYHKRNLNRHFRKHEDKQMFTCDACNKGFNTKQASDLHILRGHPDKIHLITSKIHCCDICDYKTVCKPRLIDHLQTHLSGEENNFICYLCDFQCHYKNILRRHILLTHYNSKDCKDDDDYHSLVPMQCGQCGYKSTDKSNMKKHMWTHLTQKRHKCEVCKKSFNEKKSYDSHVLVYHLGEEKFMKSITSKIYKCSLCKYQSCIQTNYQRHLQSHK